MNCGKVVQNSWIIALYSKKVENTKNKEKNALPAAGAEKIMFNEVDIYFLFKSGPVACFALIKSKIRKFWAEIW